MKPEIVKSKTDPKKYIIVAVLAGFFLVTNLVGWNKFIYSDLDKAFNPFLIATRNFGLTSNLFFREISTKAFVIRENVDLKRKITDYDDIIAENNQLKQQINILQNQTEIKASSQRKLQMIQISGSQNLYSSDPVLKLAINDLTLKPGDPVYYSKNTLFGFVQQVEGNTATVLPYYSPRVVYNIPVQNLSDLKQKGFIEQITNGKVYIRNVGRDLAINSGDIWVTTNDVTEVPAGMIVGNVKSVQKSSDGGFQEVELNIPFDLTETSYLFIEVH